MSSFRRNSDMEYRRGRDPQYGGGDRYEEPQWAQGLGCRRNRVFERKHNRRVNGRDQGQTSDNRSRFQARGYEISPERPSSDRYQEDQSSSSRRRYEVSPERPASHRNDHRLSQRRRYEVSPRRASDDRGDRGSRESNSNSHEIPTRQKLNEDNHREGLGSRSETSNSNGHGSSIQTERQNKDKAAAPNDLQAQTRNEVDPDDGIRVGAANVSKKSIFDEIFGIEEEETEEQAAQRKKEEEEEEREREELRLRRIAEMEASEQRRLERREKEKAPCGNGKIPNPYSNGFPEYLDPNRQFRGVKVSIVAAGEKKKEDVGQGEGVVGVENLPMKDMEVAKQSNGQREADGAEKKKDDPQPDAELEPPAQGVNDSASGLQNLGEENEKDEERMMEGMFEESPLAQAGTQCLQSNPDAVEEEEEQPGTVDKEVDGSQGSMEDADQPHAAGNETSELRIRLQQSTNALLQSKIAAIDAQAAIEEAKIEAAAKELKFEKERELVERNQGIRLGMLEAEGALYEEKKKRAEEELGGLRTAARGRGRARALQPSTSTAAVTQAPEVQTPEAQAPEPSVRLARELAVVDCPVAKRRKETKE
ncbi:hypothetical protein CAEBREN_10087 [Caenorhabditis brenneri]|uniref:Uncharacterized protein n=1 Tax=Caenorhabditis brenneri TaxID=135651 RepID=G0MXA1_CAEBE|nr:hypothetical protein CAEBREN_10087 [Caenorhabditis brenneri]